jgi:hypothetical protein
MALVAATELDLGPDQIAILLGPGVLGSHVGVAFRTEEGAPIEMDLAFQRLMRVQSFPSRVGAWSAAIVPLPTPLDAMVVSMLRNFAEKFRIRGQHHPTYGIALKLTEGSITPEGLYAPPAGSEGHTCSTIVAEAFRAAHAPLVDLSTWTESDEHKAWGEAVVCMLKVYAGTKRGSGTKAGAQAKLVAKNNSGHRLLPEEVAAAAQLPLDKRPASQPALVALAARAMDEMRPVCQEQDPGDYKHCVENYRKKVVALRERTAHSAEQSAAGATD